jgi:hypothetical protein
MSRVEEVEMSQVETMKYAYSSHYNGKHYARIWYDDNGEIMPISYSASYLKKQQEQAAAQKKAQDKQDKKAKKSGKSHWYWFGLSKWNPIRWVLAIIYIPFAIVWTILKFIGIAGLLGIIFGSKD